jgi:hypothetical protein
MLTRDLPDRKHGCSNQEEYYETGIFLIPKTHRIPAPTLILFRIHRMTLYMCISLPMF